VRERVWFGFGLGLGRGDLSFLFFPSKSELKIKSENASNSLYFNKTLNFILNSDLRKLIHNFEQLDDTTSTMVLDFPYDLWI
jgi:hypothetical protein